MNMWYLIFCFSKNCFICGAKDNSSSKRSLNGTNKANRCTEPFSCLIKRLEAFGFSYLSAGSSSLHLHSSVSKAFNFLNWLHKNWLIEKLY